MKQYILLDLDGTLTNSFEGIAKCFQYALTAFGIDEPELEKMRPYIGPLLMDTFMKVYGCSEEKAAALTAKYRERYNVEGWKENEVYDGIEEALQRLYNAGKTLLVATSKPQDQAIKILEHFAGFHTAFIISLSQPKNASIYPIKGSAQVNVNQKVI